MGNAIGTMDLSANNVAAIAQGIKKGFPSSVLCTDCVKGAYTMINQKVPGTFSQANETYVTNTCGASFGSQYHF